MATKGTRAGWGRQLSEGGARVSERARYSPDTHSSSSLDHLRSPHATLRRHPGLRSLTPASPSSHPRSPPLTRVARAQGTYTKFCSPHSPCIVQAHRHTKLSSYEVDSLLHPPFSAWRWSTPLARPSFVSLTEQETAVRGTVRCIIMADPRFLAREFLTMPSTPPGASQFPRHDPSTP